MKAVDIRGLALALVLTSALALVLAHVPTAAIARPSTATRGAAYVRPDARLSKLRWADGSVSVNDCCPINRHRLARGIAPLFVNGQPVGFC